MTDRRTAVAWVAWRAQTDAIRGYLQSPAVDTDAARDDAIRARVDALTLALSPADNDEAATRETATDEPATDERPTDERPTDDDLSRDAIADRVVDLVVRGDDLSRARPDRDPVPLDRRALALACRHLAETFAARVPGRSVELRVAPFIAVQAVPGPRHTRGTPPNVVETDGLTWVRLATGRLSWADAARTGAVRASGQRADLREYLPIR